MGDNKNGNWKKLLAKLKKVAPTAATVLDTAGDFVPGPAGIALEALARLVASAGPDDDMDAVASTILADPALMVRMEELSMEREKALLDNETKRIESVNATMREEARGEDAWTRRWRPFWGFISGACWGLLAVTVSVVILAVAFGLSEPTVLVAMAGAFDSMFVFWGVALAVLGVSAWKRGDLHLAREKTRGSTLRRFTVE